MKEIKKLEQLFQKGKITRREFISSMSALGLTMAVSPMLVPRSASASMPKKGGRFRMGISAGHTSDSFDPRVMVDIGALLLSWSCRNNLVEINYRGHAIPELAESWEVSSDLTTWVFNLRRGVEFHNGKTFEAEDVIYSLNLHRGETKSAVKSLVKPVKNMEADGKYRVIFTLDSGNIDFQYALTDYRMVIVPAGTKEKEWEKCIGTGAYILKKNEPGVSSFCVRNPNYWKEGRGHFDELETSIIKDDSSRTNALKSGRIDYMDSCDVKTVHLLAKDKKLQVITKTSGFHYTYPMRFDVKPYDNNDVRLALKYAVDREQLVKIALKGFGKPGNDHPIGPNLRFYAHQLTQRTYDPDKARYHLKKAGLEGHTFELSTTTSRGMSDAALLFKEHAAKAGIDINVVRKPTDGYWKEVWMKDSFVTSFWRGRPTEDTQFTAAWAADSSWNESYWRHERFNNLLKHARAEKNEGKRRDMYVEMQKICRDEGPTIVPMFKDHVMAATKKVKFSNVAGNFHTDGLRAPERWWFES